MAGSEAAWQIAGRLGDRAEIDLFEMRPERQTPAHKTDLLAELVCSNSLKSESIESPTGRLKQDLRNLDSLIIKLADKHRVPAGKALAVDRVAFGQAVTQAIQRESTINIIRQEVASLPQGYDRVIIATGPLTSDAMAQTLSSLTGGDHLYFYDAIAPVLSADSIDHSIAFRQDRYGPPGEGDYLNLPMSQVEYETFVDDLLKAEAVEFKTFEKRYYFESCLPIEEIAVRGRESLAFGPMKPVGLTDPRTGERAHAVVQLRQETADGQSYSMVGFQTKLTYGEQKRVFGTIPGLAEVEFLRYGSLHRNTYMNSPLVLNSDMTLKADDNIRLAGVLTGVEGYVESIAIGMLAGIFTAQQLLGLEHTPPPAVTTLGALLNYITDGDRASRFQPTNINFSLFPPLENRIKNKKERRSAVMERAAIEMDKWRLELLPFFDQTLGKP